MTTDDVERIIAHVVSRPPSQAGARLCSERELAERLGAGRRQVFDALYRLQARGVLVRQRGSGTYVRKVAATTPEAAEAWERAGRPDAAAFFAAARSAGRLGSPRGRQRLHVSLWSDWLIPSPTQQARMAGMLERVSARGHLMSAHAIVDAPDQPPPPEILRQRIAESASDGAIVVLRWAARFLAAAPASLPVVFCGTIENALYQPSLSIGREGVLSSAVRILAQQGFRRIAVMTVASAGLEFQAELLRRTYDAAMEAHGLAYRAFDLLPVGEVARINRRFAPGPDRPDAVFVADDSLLTPLHAILTAHGIRPGRDMGIIVVSNRKISPLPSREWSRLEYDQEAIGRMAVDMLLESMEAPRGSPRNLCVLPTWIAGTTHLKNGGASSKT